ncbi:sugar phosphate/phosphate translocator [Penicillium cataractarum]|uniref:Sugar phosphate/phosphate translocator n=1 Tax=Penicillium cataractarum TaxID=2100454 RepID=A0A9W9S435_9EURO|nr:sugar phosphate/phosphate translocator [Penicillium cataractarum]KAJ5370664.1 sugar phosphate/phosphate translocator [Penicillium cataractarum]
MANGRSSQDERKLEGGAAPAPAPSTGLHPAFYIALWIALSSSVILFNKWVLSTAKFNFPLFLTTWHMIFATAMTQGLAKFTTILDSRHKVPMNPSTYARAIVPIGIMFSLSLICGNLAYLYLSVSFIQMLKATNAVVTLFATWAFGIAPANFKTLGNVAIIVVGVVIASFGEIKFDMLGFLIQCGGIIFEALRLVMVQRLLSSAEFKMDPLVSLYYYAPACAVTNGIVTLFTDVPRMTMNDIYSLGIMTLIANALVAFLLNASVVLLIGKTSAVVLTMAGILKDILLVCASMMIFHDPVTPQQFFGYSIALAGLVYYKLGAEKLQALTTDVRLQVGEYRRANPAQAKGIAVGVVATIVLLVLYTGAPSSARLTN